MGITYTSNNTTHSSLNWYHWVLKLFECINQFNYTETFINSSILTKIREWLDKEQML